MFRRLTLVVLMAGALVACNDNAALTADIYVAPDTLTAYSLNGANPTYPSALYTVARTVVRVDGSGAFDVAFDLDTLTGDVHVLPVRLVVSSYVGAPSIGIQTETVPFDSITRAPSGYYRPDTAVTVSPGEAFVILANRNGGSTVCYELATPQIYAKVVVDSVNLTNKTVHFRTVVNPNCGYRSFLTGLPRN